MIFDGPIFEILEFSHSLVTPRAIAFGSLARDAGGSGTERTPLMKHDPPSPVASHHGLVEFTYSMTWGSAALHPRAGSPAEHLGWGARLYAFATLRGLTDGE
jgi:hypothetical protein